MTHAEERKQRRTKRHRWQHRGGAGMTRTPRAGQRKATTKFRGCGSAVVGLAALLVIGGAVTMVVLNFIPL